MSIDNVVYFGQQRGYELLLEEREKEFSHLREINFEKCTDLTSAIKYLDSLLEPDGLDSLSRLNGTVFVLNSILEKGSYPKEEIKRRFGENPYAPAMVLGDYLIKKGSPRNKVIVLKESPETEESKIADDYFEELGYKNLFLYHQKGLEQVWRKIEELVKQKTF